MWLGLLCTWNPAQPQDQQEDSFAVSCTSVPKEPRAAEPGEALCSRTANSHFCWADTHAHHHLKSSGTKSLCQLRDHQSRWWQPHRHPTTYNDGSISQGSHAAQRGKHKVAWVRQFLCFAQLSQSNSHHYFGQISISQSQTFTDISSLSFIHHGDNPMPREGWGGRTAAGMQTTEHLRDLCSHRAQRHTMEIRARLGNNY